MIVLTAIKNKKAKTLLFLSVSEAYHYYVKHYATLEEWLYYFKCCHKLLSKVDKESTMECVFDNVFRNGYINKK